MSNATQDLPLIAANDAVAGFRLDCFAIYNWGTFDGRAWQIEPRGRNQLLTGDIGSGKSTLVDGLTTLLFPSHRIIYNKAAGAERQERNAYSYVRGAFGAVQDETTRQSRGQYLRDERSYSVLLARFRNEGFDLDVTLAQVWWLKRGERNPERFYVVANRPLELTRDFSDFGGNIPALKRRLRALNHVHIEDSFERYAERFRRELGLTNQQALELFYQTVSLKSIDDLTHFIRKHMLEPTEVNDVLQRLLDDFDNLNAAHDAVAKAELQTQQLRPIVQLGERHERERNELLALRGDRDALSAWFAAQAIELWRARAAELSLEIAKRTDRRQTLDAQQSRMRDEETTFLVALREAGGDQLEAIERDIRTADEERTRRQTTANRYRELAATLELPAAANDHAFHGNRQTAQRFLDQAVERKRALDGERLNHGIALRDAKQLRETVLSDIDALKNKRSNIDRPQLEMRSALCELLNVSETRLPFVGELIEVRSGEEDWEGAIERVLRSFALSLLVPEDLYEQVARYVDRTHLNGRLVYYRALQAAERRRAPELHAKSLVKKLNLKTESEYYDWLQRELTRRFDHACCEDMDEFHRETQALTRSGQLKGGPRHEKDDRRAIDDRSRYVLGWRVEAKLHALHLRYKDAEASGNAAALEVTRTNKQLEALDVRRRAADDLLRIERYEDIHWQAEARRIEQLKAELEKLRGSSDRLATLEQQLRELRDRMKTVKEDYESEIGSIDTAKERKRIAAAALTDAQALINVLADALRDVHFPRLDAAVPQWLESAPLDVMRLTGQEKAAREKLTALVDNADGRVSRAATQLSTSMQSFRSEWAAETTDFDASPDALHEYRKLLQRLESDDLPRHRERFRRLLRENTIQGVAMLQNRLTEQEQAIQDKIQQINKSMQSIEYTRATYIRLQSDRDGDTEIRDFRTELTGILESTLGETDPYSEMRFLRVRALIERFRGRSDFLADDQRWRDKVLDVRAWFRFAASEHWRNDHKQKEYYPDTGGKSGGQKEKLAYTVLAAGLAYQFGLDWGETRSRSFRFVVIDEAFGRGSEESTRYGLELFAKLNLQLLIVTPLQKINVIEDYIHSVAFTHKMVSIDGERSAVRNLAINEYRDEKARYFGAGGA